MIEYINTDLIQPESAHSTSPNLGRASGFFNCNYDSISDYSGSGSTVMDSEYVAQRVRRYEQEQRLEDMQNNHAEKPSAIYNLHIGQVVIDGGIDGLITIIIIQIHMCIFSNRSKK